MSKFEFVRKDPILVGSGIDDIACVVKCLRTGAFIKVIFATFSNCQIFTIGYLAGVFTTYPVTPEAEYETVAEQLNEIRSLCGITKKLCQIDVNQIIFDKIKDHCNVYASMPYLNLTGSKMVSAIIKLV